MDAKLGSLQWWAQVAIPVLVLSSSVALWVYTRIATPDLSIRIDQQQVQFPELFERELEEVYVAYPDSGASAAQTAAAKAFAFIRTTPRITRVTLVNTSDEDLRNVRVRITDVASLSAYDIDSDALLEGEIQQILSSASYDQTAHIFLVDDIPSIPPRGSIRITLWGNVVADASILGNIAATFDGGHGEVLREVELIGLDALLYSDVGFVLFGLLVWALLLGLSSRERGRM